MPETKAGGDEPVRSEAKLRWLGSLVDIATLIVLVLALAAWWRVGTTRVPGPRTSPSPLTDSLLRPTEFQKDDRSSLWLPEGGGGRATLVLVFRSDCPVCARQKPAWEAAARLASGRGAQVLAVTGEPLAPEFATYFTTPLIPIGHAVVPAMIAERLHVEVVPSTILIDSGGRIRYHHQGFIADSELIAAVNGMTITATMH